MIVTLTPNPSLDRALDVDRLVLGEVNRAAAVHVHPGGKGINVSRALVAQGIASLAVLPVGGAPGEQLVTLLTEQGVRTVPVPVVGPTRTNITVVENAGVTTKINAPGTPLGLEEIDALLAAVEEQLAGGPRWLVAAGSLPPGTGDAFFVRVAGLADRYGVPLALDTSGVPLVRAVGDVVEAAREVIAAGNGDVLVSLGAHGALLVTVAGTWWAGGSPLEAVSTVGAGDTTLAGYLGATGSPAERLRTAVAWGRAAVQLPGSAVPSPADIDAGTVRVIDTPDPRLTLKEL
jgi:1-phosphofructokinase